MPELYLEIYNNDKDIAQVPVQSAVCLFTIRYLQCPPNINVNLVRTERGSSSLAVNIHSLNYDVISPEQLEPPVKDCYLPVFATVDKSVCVAGLCAVLRQVLKNSGAEWKGLLGFREGCLYACAETSLWTKFCEVDIIETVRKLLKNDGLSNQMIPEDLARFEAHLGQPIRTHNVQKVINENGLDSSNQYRFAEGHSMSLADLIIVTCIRIFVLSAESICLSQFLPQIHQWYKHVLSQPHVSEALSVIQYKPSQVNKMLSDNYIVPEVPKQSLYKSDPTRYKPKAKIYTNQEDVESALRFVRGIEDSVKYESAPFGYERIFDLSDLPEGVQPDVPLSRLKRKQQQLQNMSKAVMKIAQPGDTVVDFCCGSGHLGIVIAYCLPECHVILLDNKEVSISRAKKRVKNLGLSNITIIQCNLDYFKGKFQVGMSLHACGVATDLVIYSSVQHRAAFVVCPCCYGSLQENHVLTYPRSQVVRDTLISVHSFLVLSHCADQTHEQKYSKTEQGELCMTIVDIDRCLQAKESGYFVSLAKLIPVTCTPKNNIIVGIPETD